MRARMLTQRTLALRSFVSLLGMVLFQLLARAAQLGLLWRLRLHERGTESMGHGRACRGSSLCHGKVYGHVRLLLMPSLKAMTSPWPVQASRLCASCWGEMDQSFCSRLGGDQCSKRHSARIAGVLSQKDGAKDTSPSARTI